MKLQCYQCSNVVDSEMNYCPVCGANLKVFFNDGNKLYDYALRADEQGNLAEAIKYYRLSAKCGNVKAMYALGCIYDKGIGCAKNPDWALYSHQKAGEAGYMPSVRWLAKKYSDPDSEVYDLSKAVVYYKILADKNDDEAIDSLNSYGINKDDLEYEEEEIEYDDDSDFDPESAESIHKLSERSQGKIVKQTFVKRVSRKANYFNEEKAYLDEVLIAMKGRIEQLEEIVERKIELPDEADVWKIVETGEKKERRATAYEELEILTDRLSNPFFGHLRLECIEDGETVDMYVGQDLIYINNRFYVFSHNSEIGSYMYARFLDNVRYKEYTYNVIFRRKINIQNGELKEVFEDYVKGKDGEGRANISYDKFLESILARKKNDKKLSDIIATIQENQNQIVVADPQAGLILQGCAGSGKTMIMLQRLEYLKYRNAIDLKKVAIITPSEEFKQHIMPVCRDLRITDAKLYTRAEYYLEKLSRYLSGVQKKANFRNVLKDEEYPDVASYYYSAEFIEKCENALAGIKNKLIKDWKEYTQKVKKWENLCGIYAKSGIPRPNRAEYVGSKPQKPYITIFSKAVKDIAYKRTKTEEVMPCEIYASLLINYFLIGPLPIEFTDKNVYVDEGQDVNLSEYKLIKCINGDTVTLNVFGDIYQRIDDKSGIADWKQMEETGDFSEYELNENYRNTKEIIGFINEKLGKDIIPLGLDGNKVMRISPSEIMRFIGYDKSDRVAILFSSRNKEYERYKSRVWFEDFVFTVQEAKGIEYDKVFVFDRDMSDSEKYVAYSRALSYLYIVN